MTELEPALSVNQGLPPPVGSAAAMHVDEAAGTATVAAGISTRLFLDFLDKYRSAGQPGFRVHAWYPYGTEALSSPRGVPGMSTQNADQAVVHD
jgi:hypothetical protein